MIHKLADKDISTLHERYRSNDLFLQWSPILATIERYEGGLDAVSYWHLSEELLSELRRITTHREEAIQHLYNRLLKDFSCFKSSQRDLFSAIVMCLLYTSLMNPVEEGHEDEDFENSPMCVAIRDAVKYNPAFTSLLKKFFSRKTGYDGKKVVITPYDPMKYNLVLDDLTEENRNEVTQIIDFIKEKTSVLKILFGDEKWEKWVSLIKKVCLDNTLFMLLKEVKPRQNDWEINQILVLNLIGIFRVYYQLNVPITRINDALWEHNKRSYIAKHEDYGRTNCALTKEQHDSIVKMLTQI